jgi:N-carbamoyl-L-amino-acid hydrolase
VLLDFCELAVRDVTGTAHRLPSGPLHDAAEVARAGVPTVMMFTQSLHGISHNKIEDTKEEHILMSVRAFDQLAEQTVHWVADQPA